MKNRTAVGGPSRFPSPRCLSRDTFRQRLPPPPPPPQSLSRNRFCQHSKELERKDIRAGTFTSSHSPAQTAVSQKLIVAAHEEVETRTIVLRQSRILLSRSLSRDRCRERLPLGPCLKILLGSVSKSWKSRTLVLAHSRFLTPYFSTRFESETDCRIPR